MPGCGVAFIYATPKVWLNANSRIV
jgi:hypothetical protein